MTQEDNNMAKNYLEEQPRIGDIVRNDFEIKNFIIVEIYNSNEVGIIEIYDPSSLSKITIQKIERVDINTLHKRY